MPRLDGERPIELLERLARTRQRPLIDGGLGVGDGDLDPIAQREHRRVIGEQHLVAAAGHFHLDARLARHAAIVVGELGSNARRDHADLLGAGNAQFIRQRFLIELRRVALHRPADDAAEQIALLRRE
jgi:hypothetical protein